MRWFSPSSKNKVVDFFEGRLVRSWGSGRGKIAGISEEEERYPSNRLPHNLYGGLPQKPAVFSLPPDPRN
jgi:hypothetical protein